MLIPVLGVIFGVLIGYLFGFVFDYDIPYPYIKYTAIGILAALDAIMGGIRAQLSQKFVFSKFISSFFTNVALAALLAYIGDLVGVDIHMGAVVAFSIRLFQNLSLIREELFDRFWWWHIGGKEKEM
ncbi:MAG TPA: small basic family protein [Bacillota bacterium]|jgi:small basic protein|nr:small basic family protein [Bacillota bacterium]HOL10487.1 small basic family protein [Bacillota bacterium]HPO98226.1 small basic family protein [Bacillota bacterium]